MNFDTQGAATWQEFGYQLRAAPTLTATATETTTAGQARVDLTWTGVDANHWTPAPDVTYTVTRTEGSAVETLAEDLAELLYTDSPARSGATYTYRVAAVVDGGEAVLGVLVVNTPGNSPAGSRRDPAGPVAARGRRGRGRGGGGVRGPGERRADLRGRLVGDGRGHGEPVGHAGDDHAGGGRRGDDHGDGRRMPAGRPRAGRRRSR